MSAIHGRQTERERFWRETVGAWRKSGQTVRDFCGERGLQEPSFYHWRRTLRQRDEARRDEARAVERGPTLVPLHVVPGAVLEVALPNGIVVRVPAGTQATAVAELIGALVALGVASC